MFLKGYSIADGKNILVSVDHISAVIGVDEAGITCLVNGGEVSISKKELYGQDNDYYRTLYENALCHLTGEEIACKPLTEPDYLCEIAKVTVELGRVCLTILEGYERMSIKFGLSENYQRYEFDGTSLFFYRKVGEKPSWSCSCGRGGHTLVDSSTSKCIREVKMEMARQILSNGLDAPFSVTEELPLSYARREIR